MESARFRFGLFEFNAATRELRREGAVVRLQAQPAQVLACLVERAGQVVSRSELREEVWGGETFVDFEGGLNFCISQIRSALQDDSAKPAYIRTIPKQGYRFIAPVERISGSRPVEEKPALSAGRVYSRPVKLAVAGGILALLIFAAGYWLRPGQSSKPVPIIAVLRFDNETGDPGMTRFSDGLTDTVVERLASLGHDHYQIIGNAQILRVPRDERDLKAIGASLHATFVVLGQVQLNGDKVRVLAHLIRLPDQTHVWVVRMDRTLEDPLMVQSEAAQKIAAEFSPRVSADSRNTDSLSTANR